MLIVTSVNPSTRLKHQMACYKKWKRLGYNYLTFNCLEEASKLIEEGLDEEDIFIINDEFTAKKIHGFNAPKIKPIIDILIHKIKPDYLILTNSDIFPNVDKPMSLLPNVLTCACFTRREVFAIELCNNSSFKHYRGGLDIFAFNDHSLLTLWMLIKDDDLAERMTFGVPGWDFYVGALVLSDKLQGKILDGTVFSHVSHLTTYSHVKEFDHYVSKMREMGLLGSYSCEDAAFEFAKRIEVECELNNKISTFLHLLYTDNLRVSDQDFNLSNVEFDIKDLLKADIFHNSSDCSILVRQAIEEEINLVAFKSYFCLSPSIEIQFCQYLSCLYFLLFIKNKMGHYKLTSKYPPNNNHKAAIVNVLKLTNSFEIRYYLIDILCSELICSGIINKNLLRAVAQSCINDRERWFVTEIITLIANNYVTPTA